jgi:hypothetical protein
MTDTSKEAVERFADRLDRGATWNGDWKHEAADFLRALLRELDDALGKAALNEQWAVESELQTVQLLRELNEARARVAAAYEDASQTLSKLSRGVDCVCRSDDIATCLARCSVIRALATDAERDALAERDARIRKEGMDAIITHLKTMYPDKWKALGPSCHRSLGGLKANAIRAQEDR